ncbi:MAG: Do family serine endopeptidase [Pseudomonadota bacterium]
MPLPPPMPLPNAPIHHPSRHRSGSLTGPACHAVQPGGGSVRVSLRAGGQGLSGLVVSAGLAISGVFATSAMLIVPDNPANARGPVSVAPVAEKLIDAVVNISSRQVAKGPKGVPLPKVPEGSPFEEFFDDFFNPDGGGPGVQRKVSSLGSGFVIDAKEGLVVTNNHVIADADEIIINFSDGSKLVVDKVLGRDVKTDLALLKVTPDPNKPLTAVKFGVSRTLKVGDWVMAIGNPFGLGGTVTVGIISAKQRNINSGPYDDYLQTDAAINKGNSGGPLFNMDGDVIGVNTAIISPTGGSIGIGFAVPSDVAMNVIDQLNRFGETRRGWLGVKIQTVTDEIASSLGVAAGEGALVAAVENKSPAEGGGIKAGDVITEFDGKPVPDMRSLPKIVAQTQIGKTVPVVVMREGKKTQLSIEIARLDEGGDDVDAGAAGADTSTNEVDPNDLVSGATLAELTDDLRNEFNLNASVQGLVITDVKLESAAAQKGIKRGDVIVEVAQQPVKTLKDVAENIARVRASGRRAVLLRIENGRGEMRFVAIPLSS